MIVAHIGPALARTGGPAGYLWQLRDALDGTRSSHRVLMPAAAAPTGTVAAARPSIAARIRRRLLRAVTGAPRFYRPSRTELRRRGGEIDRMLTAALADMARAAEASLQQGLAQRADVLFAHDLGTAAAALDRRAGGQQVWLMLHSPMSMALYLAWNWGVPEQDWREVLDYPDVRLWTEYEVQLCSRADRLVLPCREAADDLVRCDARFAPLLAHADILATGATRGGSAIGSRAALRAKWRLPIDQPVGLFLGSLQAYRGFDALVAGLDRLADLTAVPGTIAVAGPDPAAVPPHDRIRALGRVEYVSSLLHAVDFVVNVNRFSLFDLSLIEALEAARPVLLHDAGGNRAFRALGCGSIPLADLRPDTIAAGVERCFSMSRPELDRLGRQSRHCYELHLTPGRFAERHLNLYRKASGAARRAQGPTRVTA